MKSDFRDLEAFFFDFDGVLADSVEVKTRAFAKLFEPHGPDIMDQVVAHHRNHGGMTRVEKFKYYYKELINKPLSYNELDRLCIKFSSLVVDEVVASPEIPGAEEFLEKWYKEVKCFVVSATPDEEIIEIVRRRNLDKYFHKVLGSSNSKADNLRSIIKSYNLEPDACLFFGDATSDYQAARSCGVNFIGILPGEDAPLLKVAYGIRWAKNFLALNNELFL